METFGLPLLKAKGVPASDVPNCEGWVNNVVEIPISMTWSNRTELIQESDIRGQIGLTLDLDAVFRK